MAAARIPSITLPSGATMPKFGLGTWRMGEDPRRRTDEVKALAHGLSLGVTLIQVSERDTQATDRPKRPNEFVNTWSIDGFVDELMQPSELSLGTSEPKKPAASASGSSRPPP